MTADITMQAAQDREPTSILYVNFSPPRRIRSEMTAVPFIPAYSAEKPLREKSNQWLFQRCPVSTRGAYRDRHEREAGCGGRESAGA
jgi:hypothetical protein